MMFAGSPMSTMLKMIEELGAELEVDQFRSAFSRAEWRVFDHRQVEVVERRPAEGVAAKRAESPLIRPGASADVDGNGEEIGGVVCALAEVVLADFARGGEMRRGDLIGPVDAI